MTVKEITLGAEIAQALASEPLPFRTIHAD
jgi:hypothetical protein